MNYFEYRSVAERYARHRPYIHPLVIQKIKDFLSIESPIDLAVDAGCGPGQSTTALKAIADFVIGADISAEMLSVAGNYPGIQYIRSPAEALPIRDRVAGLVTTFLAYHWFDPQRFLAESRRILRDGAWLIISNNGFTGQMEGDRDFEDWIVGVYDRRYPSPPRNAAPMTPRAARRHGFHFVHAEEYWNEVQFTAEQMAAYLVTQSNVIAATEQGDEPVEEVFRWILAETRPLFKTERPAFVFKGYIWYLQKAS